MLMTGACKEDLKVILDWVPCVYYLVQFRKDKEIIQALIDSSSNINTITPAYIKKLGLRTRKIDAGAQKIDGSNLDMFEMVITGFQIVNKQGRAWFFQETFLLVNITMEVVLRMPFLIFNNADI